MTPDIPLPVAALLRRFGRPALRSIGCVLLAIVSLTGGRSAPVSVSAQDCLGCPVSSQLDATSFDARLPFLTGSGPLVSGQFEAPQRTTRLARTQSFASDGQLDAQVRTSAAAAVRVRIARTIHATISRTLALAQAGPAEARSTPPPFVS